MSCAIQFSEQPMLLIATGDAYTGNWLISIKHTPKLARKVIVSQ